MKDDSWQIILKVGCEGGVLSLCGKRPDSGWIFKMVTDESSLDGIIKKEDLCGELVHESNISSSWEGAVSLLNTYPYWPSLYPMQAHRDFSTHIMDALYSLRNSSDYPADMGEVDWERWKEVLSDYKEENFESMEIYGTKSYFVNSVPPPSGRLIVKRDGRSITRRIPKPTVLVDTREKDLFTFGGFSNWIAGTKIQTLKVGDYSVEGMESLLVLERKSLPDLISTLIHERTRFFKLCEKMAKFRWKGLLVEATYEDVKSPYDSDYTQAHPNAVSGTLDALEARYGIPVIYTSRYKRLAEEKAASWLSKHFTYWYLESQGLGRVLQEGDL